MGFLNQLRRLFGGRPAGVSGRFYPVAVRCRRCGEIIETQINLANDLSAEFDEASGATLYHCRKLLAGKARCFQTVEVELQFDADRRLLQRTVHGGSFADEPAKPAA